MANFTGLSKDDRLWVVEQVKPQESDRLPKARDYWALIERVVKEKK